jgi:hypothetical protein
MSEGSTSVAEVEVRAEKWKFLQDEPCAQVISYEGDRIPSFLPKCMMANHNNYVEYGVGLKCRVAAATISRKPKCIVITWCSTATGLFTHGWFV